MDAVLSRRQQVTYDHGQVYWLSVSRSIEVQRR